MTKELSQYNQEEQQTPQQMNGELITLFNQLPNGKIEEENTVKRKIMLERVTKLIQNAPITENFHNYILNLYKENYQKDVWSEEKPQIQGEDPFFFLDREDPQSGGIFDSKRALEHEHEAVYREMEHKLYNEGDSALESVMAHLNRIRNNSNMITKHFGLPGKYTSFILEGLYAGQLSPDLEKQVQQWAKEADGDKQAEKSEALQEELGQINVVSSNRQMETNTGEVFHKDRNKIQARRNEYKRTKEYLRRWEEQIKQCYGEQDLNDFFFL